MWRIVVYNRLHSCIVIYGERILRMTANLQISNISRHLIRQHTRMLVLAICVGVAAFACPPAGATGNVNAEARGWPEFRGPWGNGHAAAPGETLGLPLRWNERENVVWKTAIPHQGWSTPVILGGQVWLTTATEDGHDFFVLCVAADTGEILFNERLFHSDNPEPLGNEVNSYASPSPAIEPGRVYVHFGSYGTACLDTQSFETVWERTDLECRHYRGPGSSAVLHDNLLLLTFDGADVQYVAALDKATGETVWKTHRSTEWTDLDPDGQPLREGDFRKSFTTPLVIPVSDRELMISPASFAAFAYDVRTGQEIWHTTNLSYSPAPRPVFASGLLFLTTGRGSAEIWALRPDGEGDVTDTHVVWHAGGSFVPSEPSPLLVDGLLYLVSNSGTVTCFEAQSGKEVWSHRLGGNYLASPVYADGRIYICNTRGRTSALEAGRAAKVLATNELDAGCLASPAVAGKALFLRTRTHLYRIETED